MSKARDELQKDLMEVLRWHPLIPRGTTISEHDVELFLGAIDAYISEVIGNDDPNDGHTNREILNHFENRNKLRAEQRLRAGL